MEIAAIVAWVYYAYAEEVDEGLFLPMKPPNDAAHD